MPSAPTHRDHSPASVTYSPITLVTGKHAPLTVSSSINQLVCYKIGNTKLSAYCYHRRRCCYSFLTYYILLIVRIFPRPFGARQNTTQLAKYSQSNRKVSACIPAKYYATRKVSACIPLFQLRLLDQLKLTQQDRRVVWVVANQT